jgi:hypothetical protein
MRSRRKWTGGAGEVGYDEQLQRLTSGTHKPEELAGEATQADDDVRDDVVDLSPASTRPDGRLGQSSQPVGELRTSSHTREPLA